MNVYFKGVLFLYNPSSFVVNTVINYIANSIDASTSYVYRALNRAKYFTRKKKTTNII